MRLLKLLKTSQKTLVFGTLLALLFLLSGCGSDSSSPSTDTGRSVTLDWTNRSNSAAGFKVYYSHSGPSFPLGVTGAHQGSSPVDVGLATHATLSGFDTEGIQYFMVTAYDQRGTESRYSNIVATVDRA